MIVWQGLGCLVIIIPIIVGSLILGITSLLFPTFNENILIFLVLVCSGIILYKLGKILHNPKTNEITLYDENMEPHTIKRNIDTLYWIPIEIWGIILICFGIVNFLPGILIQIVGKYLS